MKSHIIQMKGHILWRIYLVEHIKRHFWNYDVKQCNSKTPAQHYHRPHHNHDDHGHDDDHRHDDHLRFLTKEPWAGRALPESVNQPHPLLTEQGIPMKCCCSS